MQSANPPPRSETEAPDLELPAPVRRFELRVIEGRDAGARYVGNGERTVIGTDASADLRLSDPTVSRRHCELVLADGRVDYANTMLPATRSRTATMLSAGYAALRK